MDYIKETDDDGYVRHRPAIDESGIEEERLQIMHEKRKERSREYARRKRRELSLVQDKLIMIYNELVRMGSYQKLSADAKEFFDVYIHREEKARTPYPPTLYAMFGSAIAPGSACTLREAMQRLYKGKNEINFLIKRWRERHGVHVKIEPADNGDALEMRYVIVRVDPLESHMRVDDVRDIMSPRERSEFRAYESRKQ